MTSDHSPDNVKFPDISMTVYNTPAHVKCYSYHASTSVIVSGGAGMQQCMIQTKMKSTIPAKSRMDAANMQLTTKSFMPLFADKIFFPDTSLTAVKFPDISRFSRQLVTLFPGDCRTITKTKALIYICITDWLQHYVSYTVYVVYSSLYFCKQKIQWKIIIYSSQYSERELFF